MLTQVQLEAIYRRLSVNSEAIDHLLVRANTRDEDITELTRRIEGLRERVDKQRYLSECDVARTAKLEKRIEQLERLLEKEE